MYLTEAGLQDLALVDEEPEFRKSWYGDEHHFCFVSSVAGMPEFPGISQTKRSRFFQPWGFYNSDSWRELIERRELFPCGDGCHAWLNLTAFKTLDKSQVHPLDMSLAKYLLQACEEAYGAEWNSTYGCCDDKCEPRGILPSWRTTVERDVLLAPEHAYTLKNPDANAALGISDPRVGTADVDDSIRTAAADQEHAAKQREWAKKWLANTGI